MHHDKQEQARKRQLSFWLYHDWTTGKTTFNTYDDGFVNRPVDDQKVYYVRLELDHDVQFPPALPEAEGSRVIDLLYKTPAYAPGSITLSDALEHLPGRIANLVEHLFPANTYGSDLGPLGVDWTPSGIHIELPQGINIDIAVQVTERTGPS